MAKQDSKYEIIMCCDCDNIIRIKLLNVGLAESSKTIDNFMTFHPWCKCLWDGL